MLVNGIILVAFTIGKVRRNEVMAMTVGERIKKRRRKLKLPITTVAEALGKDKTTVYRYESNFIEDLPSSVIEPLARALRTTPAYLMGWSEELTDKQLEILQRVDCLEGKFSFADEVGRGEIEFLIDCGMITARNRGGVETFGLTEKGKKAIKTQGVAPEFELRPCTVITVNENGEKTVFEQVGKREMNAVTKLLKSEKRA